MCPAHSGDRQFEETAIGQRPASLPPEETDPNSTRTQELKDGDELRVGHTIFHIAIVGSAELQEVYFPMQTWKD